MLCVTRKWLVWSLLINLGEISWGSCLHYWTPVWQILCGKFCVAKPPTRWRPIIRCFSVLVVVNPATMTPNSRLSGEIRLRQTSNISRTKSQNTFLVLSCSCLCPICWSQVLSRELRCSWSRPTGDQQLYCILRGAYIRGLTITDTNNMTPSTWREIRKTRWQSKHHWRFS